MDKDRPSRFAREIRLEPGDRVNRRFVVQSPIGQGSVAQTYRAADEQTGRDVALKIIAAREILDWREVELFQKEIRVLRGLGHPRIPDYLDLFQTECAGAEAVGIAQEYIEGRSLYERVKAGMTFTLPQVYKILEDVLEALFVTHSLQPPIVHRAIHPKNIVLNDGGEMFLVEFGAVGCIAASTVLAMQPEAVRSRLGYMPPEQFYGKVEPALDIYALGVTIVFVLTGKEPGELELKRMRLDYHAYVSIPHGFRRLLDEMIEPDPRMRASDVGEILEKLRATLRLKDPSERIRMRHTDARDRARRRAVRFPSRVQVEEKGKRAELVLGPYGFPRLVGRLHRRYLFLVPVLALAAGLGLRNLPSPRALVQVRAVAGTVAGLVTGAGVLAAGYLGFLVLVLAASAVLRLKSRTVRVRVEDDGAVCLYHGNPGRSLFSGSREGLEIVVRSRGHDMPGLLGRHNRYWGDVFFRTAAGLGEARECYRSGLPEKDIRTVRRFAEKHLFQVS